MNQRPPTRVLIVEDERLVARELQLHLEDLGYVVLASVASADDAIVAASAQVPDLVLMDIRIQGARDGIEAAAILRRDFDVPVVFLTAYRDEATLARAKTVDPAGYLTKPLKEGELHTAVEIAVHTHALKRQLRERERWFSATLQSIGDAVISTDARGHVTFMNPVAESITGWRTEAARGLPLVEVFRMVEADSRADMPNPIARALEAGRVVRAAGGLATTGAGSTSAVVDAAASIVDDGGTVLGGVVVFRDVSEQREVERRFAAAERMASLGTLAAGLAHELNNPLALVVANLRAGIDALRVGRDRGGDPVLVDEVVALLDEAGKGAERIERVVADLDGLSRPGVGGRITDVTAAVRRALAVSAARIPSGVAVVVAAPEALHARIDPQRLEQVLGHLIGNAADAIAAAGPRSHQLAIRAWVVDDRTVIEVGDTGDGMAAAVQARAFEPFFTTKPPGRGAGLGLAICHGIVIAAGGTIELASSERGTTVQIRLAGAPPPALAAPVAASAEPLQILVVDDEPMIRRAVARMLRAGNVVVEADGPAALRRFEAGERFDAVTCDLMMPDLSGMELYAHALMLDAGQARRFIFVTGGATSIGAAEFLATVRNPVVEKPFRPAALIAALNEVLVAAPRPRG